MCLGIPGEVIALQRQRRPALRARCASAASPATSASTTSRRRCVGDFVLVHVGFAIAKIDRDEAARAWQVLEEIGQTPSSTADVRGAVAMKYLDEYRDADVAAGLLARRSRATATRPWVLMEVCGGQTHSIVRYGIDRMLPAEVELVHGPGCPVCVTALETIDRAHAIAAQPGRHLHLLRRHAARARLARRSAARCGPAAPTCAWSTRRSTRSRIARAEPRQAAWCSSASASRPPRPPTRWRCSRRTAQGVPNFSMLVSHVLVPPAIAAILQAPRQPRAGFLGPGPRLRGDRATANTRRWRHATACPIVITGFEPVDLLEGDPDGGAPARGGPRRGREPVRAHASRARATARRSALIAEVFEVIDRKWRGVGAIPKSGYRHALRVPRARRRAAVRGRGHRHRASRAACISGLVLRGLKKPSRLPGVRQDAARRRRRSARRWCPPRAPAPPTTSTGATVRSEAADDAHDGGHPAQGAARAPS